MTGTVYFLVAIAVSAVITFGLRALPFVLFRGGRSMPDWMKRLGQILPSAIMAVLVVAVSYKWKHNTFISIIAGTAVYMVMLRVI